MTNLYFFERNYKFKIQIGKELTHLERCVELFAWEIYFFWISLFCSHHFKLAVLIFGNHIPPLASSVFQFHGFGSISDCHAKSQQNQCSHSSGYTNGVDRNRHNDYHCCCRNQPNRQKLFSHFFSS